MEQYVPIQDRHFFFFTEVFNKRITCEVFLLKGFNLQSHSAYWTTRYFRKHNQQTYPSILSFLENICSREWTRYNSTEYPLGLHNCSNNTWNKNQYLYMLTYGTKWCWALPSTVRAVVASLSGSSAESWCRRQKHCCLKLGVEIFSKTLAILENSKQLL